MKRGKPKQIVPEHSIIRCS